MINDKKSEKVIVDLAHSDGTEEIQKIIDGLGETNFTLYITDDPVKAKSAKKLETAVLIYLHESNKSCDFSEFRYFIEGFEDVDITYLERIYKREKKFPWTIGETKRLRVREMRVEEADILYDLYSDKSVVEYMEDLPQDMETEKEYMRQYIDIMYGCNGFGMWFIECKESGQIIGRVGFQTCDEENVAELGFMIRPEYQGMGYAYEACEVAIAYMREEFPYLQLRAKCHRDNYKSIELCKKLNMEILLF